MSKTFTYVLIVIGVYVAIIAVKAVTGQKAESTETTENKTSTTERKTEKGASGRLSYQIGASSVK